MKENKATANNRPVSSLYEESDSKGTSTRQQLGRTDEMQLLTLLVWGIFCQEVWVGRRIFSFVSFFARSAGSFPRLVGARDDDQRGARLQSAEQSRHNLVFGGSKDPNHDAVMRIGSEAPRRRTHSLLRRDKPCSVSGHRHLEPSHRLPSQLDGLGLLRRAQNDAVRHYALSHEPPQGDQKLARQGHDHGLTSAASILGAGSKPLR
jgi:hypothetical protein